MNGAMDIDAGLFLRGSRESSVAGGRNSSKVCGSKAGSKPFSMLTFAKLMGCAGDSEQPHVSKQHVALVLLAGCLPLQHGI
jgi:hypothetical protein